jgi:hypothetical protein
MRTLSLSLSFAIILAVPAFAQEPAGMAMPQPAPQLEKLELMLGNWVGSGQVAMGADAKPTPWTSESVVQRVLGGFFVEERLHVSFGEAMPPLVMHNFYGWDADTEQYRVVGVNNTGATDVSTMHFSGASTLVGAAIQLREGQPVLERWVARYAGDACELSVDQAIGSAPFFTHVTGKFTRAPARGASFSLEDVGAMGPVASELGKLRPLVGKWRVKGTMVPAPGAPEMAIAGTETVKPVFGGVALASHTLGDPTPGMPGTYESIGYYVWDAAHRAYDVVYVSNMGEAGRMEGRFAGEGTIVWTSDQRYMGSASANRIIQTITGSGDGRTLRVVSDRLLGTDAAVRDFTAEYVIAK